MTRVSTGPLDYDAIDSEPLPPCPFCGVEDGWHSVCCPALVNPDPEIEAMPGGTPDPIEEPSKGWDEDDLPW